MTRTEKDRLEEENRELNRNQMAEKHLMEKCLVALDQGAISPIQVDEWLSLTGAPVSLIERVSKRIKDVYSR